MGAFAGGSAYAMANQICEGYSTLSAVSVRRYTDAELGQLRLELDKIVTTLRAEVIPEGEMEKVKARNRKVSRVNQATLVLQNHLQKKNR
ncbi:MAG: hypothetical protein U0166_08920 [Acidobacteriota bacterium]